MIVETISLSTCEYASTEAECIDLNCQPVKGSLCSAPQPPCNLNFNSEKINNCCLPGNDTLESDVVYLGCVSNVVCLTQCMQHIPSGDIYAIWEGCAFDSDKWRDVSTDSTCDLCFSQICPAGLGDELIDWLFVFTSFCFISATVLSVVVPSYFIILWITRKWNKKNNDAENSDFVVRTKNTSKPYIPVTRLKNGLIAIKVNQDKTIVVTPEQYQHLYEVQQTKVQKQQ